jgi:hypothetical protein
MNTPWVGIRSQQILTQLATMEEGVRTYNGFWAWSRPHIINGVRDELRRKKHRYATLCTT